MSGGKKFWLIWCVAWALFWITAGWLLPLVNLFFFFGSVLAMLPAFAGNQPRALPSQVCPVCGGGFVAPALPEHMARAHGIHPPAVSPGSPPRPSAPHR